MDRNLILAIALSFAVVLTYQTWRATQGSQESAKAPVSATEGVGEQAVAGSGKEVGEIRAGYRPTEEEPLGDSAPGKRVTIENAFFRAELTTRGAGISSWQLKGYRESSAVDAAAIELAPGTGVAPALATPLEELGLGNLSRAPFDLIDAGGAYAVFGISRNGITVRKRFELDASQYGLRMRVEVENQSTEPVNATFATRWPAVVRLGPDFTHESLIALHSGSVVREAVHGLGAPGFFSGGGPPKTISLEGDVDWAGVDSTYFLVAVVAPQPREAVSAFEPGSDGASATVWLGYPPSAVPSGLSDTREYRVFAGPKEPAILAAFGFGVEASVQLGWKWIAPLTKAFLWLLRSLHAVIPNYGVGIILLTILVRLATHPLNVRQMSSMKRMSELQPKIQELQQKFADNRQKQSEEMMKLYREAGVNPLGGCFPILLQFPVLMGLYYALQSSIDLRQAPFVGWIQDLSAPEALFTVPGFDLPIRLLPIVMGASMVVQQKLTPSTMDPRQAQMMMIVMPVMFTFMFYQLPSGLVLYWFVSNLLAIGSQVWMQRGQTASPVRS